MLYTNSYDVMDLLENTVEVINRLTYQETDKEALERIWYITFILNCVLYEKIGYPEIERLIEGLNEWYIQEINKEMLS